MQIAILAPIAGLVAYGWWVATDSLKLSKDARHVLVMALSWITIPVLVALLAAILSRFF